MSDKTTTLIVSDLHLGGGANDPGDDHVYQGQQLERFVRQQLASPAGQAGQIELFFNGDFFEFAQVLPEAYRGRSSDFWCSEAESVQKLAAILCGHADIFAALRDLQEAGNQVTVAAGNHDIDLYWPTVQQHLRNCVGVGLRFETGQEWVERHAGRLQIAHGHCQDPANRFQQWADPIRAAPDGPRLEMCPGTLFMTGFVNALEAQFPFADNLHPVQNLAGVLLRENKKGFASAGWLLLKFSLRHGKTLGSSEMADVGRRLLARLRDDDAFARQLAAAINDRLDESATAAQLRDRVRDETALADLMSRLLLAMPVEDWCELFASTSGATLGSADNRTLGTIIGARHFGKQDLRDQAEQRFIDVPAAQVVVMGHTHLPDQRDFQGRKYFNPGSWTRYLDLDRHPNLSLNDLRDGSRFPYQLNYVHVEASATGLQSRMECFESGG